MDLQIHRGEIIRINLMPTQGREQSGDARPCLVLSHTKFNSARQGIVVITPITNTIKPEVQTMLLIPDGFRIHGSVIAEQIRTVDLNQRWWKTTGEILPAAFVNKVVQTLNMIIGEV
ncbi:MAG: type II toxin-antitoxin system PemK/MazF family toxin [Prochlorotrichaceae cyanobacterium]|jgi:mRNA-degrading endonuclease toxin of MazEF toxin-antitoxin module